MVNLILAAKLPWISVLKLASYKMKTLSFLIVGAAVALSPLHASAASRCSKLLGVSICHERSNSSVKSRSDQDSSTRSAVKAKPTEPSSTEKSDSDVGNEQSKHDKRAANAAKRADKARARAERLNEQA